jgi:hypothetical protein
MRTTLDIDDDVLQAVKTMARNEGETVGKMISILARRGLASAGLPEATSYHTRGGVPLLPSRGELVTLEHIQNLAGSPDGAL